MGQDDKAQEKAWEEQRKDEILEDFVAKCMMSSGEVVNYGNGDGDGGGFIMSFSKT